MNAVDSELSSCEQKVRTSCSIIFSAGNDRARLASHLSNLSKMHLPPDCEVIIINEHDLQIDEISPAAQLPRLQVVTSKAARIAEELYDTAALQARGRYLLFIRGFTEFDKSVLAESIQELQAGGEKISVSANKNFVLIDHAHFVNVGGFRGLSQGVLFSNGHEPREQGSKQTGHFRNLRNEYMPLEYGPGTFIDPDVIIDSPQSVKIGSNCTIRKGVVLRPEGGEIIIGDNCVINHYSILHAKGGIYIGDWTVIAPHCGFYAQNHTYERFDIPITKQPSIGKGIFLMGDNWIGAHAIICDDVTIGKGAVVRANSTLSQSIPMACIAEGSPAQLISKRYSGAWDFAKQERAVSEGMPQKIYQHVIKRAMLIQELIEPNDDILDVGCGEGIVTGILARKTKSMAGCDYSSEAIEVARQRYPHIAFTYSNSTNLRFENCSFTKVILSDVAEHLMPMQFIKTLDEVLRVLESRGKVIVATPLTGNRKSTSTYAHIYEYSKEEIAQILHKMFCSIDFVNECFGIFIAQKR